GSDRARLPGVRRRVHGRHAAAAVLRRVPGALRGAKERDCVSFDPFARALLDAFAHLERRLAAVEAKLAANEGLASDYVTPAEAAKLRGVSAAAIRARIRSGALPAVREGKLLFIRRDDLEPPPT